MPFDKIVRQMTDLPDVTSGKMMSAPGIKYKGKVFAYRTKDKMGFKLGKGFDIEAQGVEAFNTK